MNDLKWRNYVYSFKRMTPNSFNKNPELYKLACKNNIGLYRAEVFGGTKFQNVTQYFIEDDRKNRSNKLRIGQWNVRSLREFIKVKEYCKTIDADLFMINQARKDFQIKGYNIINSLPA